MSGRAHPLRHGPGAFGAIVVATPPGGAPRGADDDVREAVRHAARALLAEPWPEGVHALVAIGARLAGVGAVPLASTDEGALFVQLACDAAPPRDAALDRVRALLAASPRAAAPTVALPVVEEVRTARIGDGREAFGFKDGASPSDAQLAAAMHDDGTAALLWMRWSQDVDAFARLSLAAQERAIGARKDGGDLPQAPHDAHVWRQRFLDDTGRPTDHETHGTMVRRGLPLESRDGLAFVAFAKETATLALHLARLDGDALSRAARAQSGGTFFVVPDADALDRALERGFGAHVMLAGALAPLAAVDWLRRVVALGALEGPLGAQRPAPTVQPVIDALHTVLAGGVVTVKEEAPGEPSLVAELDRRAGLSRP